MSLKPCSSWARRDVLTLTNLKGLTSGLSSSVAKTSKNRTSTSIWMVWWSQIFSLAMLWSEKCSLKGAQIYKSRSKRSLRIPTGKTISGWTTPEFTTVRRSCNWCPSTGSKLSLSLSDSIIQRLKPSTVPTSSSRWFDWTCQMKTLSSWSASSSTETSHVVNRKFRTLYWWLATSNYTTVMSSGTKWSPKLTSLSKARWTPWQPRSCSMCW